MRRLSFPKSPMPSLAERGKLLTVEAKEVLDRERVAHPGPHVANIYWQLVEQLQQMFACFEFGSLSPEGQEQARRKRMVISQLELLMHRCALLNTYMGRLIYALLPAGEGKKNRGADAVKRRVDAQILRLFKLPINAVKHSDFRLAWIEMYRDDRVVHGFTVTGPIGQGVDAPVKFKSSNGSDTEAYSYALTLREVLPSIYLMCEIVEEALAASSLFTAGEGERTLPGDVRQGLLDEALAGLNALPMWGFPDEDKLHVSILEHREEAIYAGSQVLRAIPGVLQVTTELSGVRGGGTYKMPYFKPEDVHKTMQERKRRG